MPNLDALSMAVRDAFGSLPKSKSVISVSLDSNVLYILLIVGPLRIFDLPSVDTEVL